MSTQGEPLPPHPRYPGALDTAIWLMPDEDLWNAIDSMASTRQARGNAIGFYCAAEEHEPQNVELFAHEPVPIAEKENPAVGHCQRTYLSSDCGQSAPTSSPGERPVRKPSRAP